MTEDNRLPENNKIRNRTYCIIAWLLLGAILAVAAFFTCVNGFNSLSFSQKDNDTYVISEELLTKERYKENNDAFIAIVCLEHSRLNYLRVSIDGIEGDDQYFSFLGTNSLAEEPIEKIVSYDDVKLHNGNNDFDLTSQDFSVAVFVFSDINAVHIDRIEFRERIDAIPVGDGLKTVSVALTVYTMLSGLFAFIISTFRQKKRFKWNTIQENRKLITKAPLIDPGKLPTIFGNNTQIVRILICFAILVLSLLIAIKGEAYYRDHLGTYVCIQLVFTVFLVMTIPDNHYPHIMFRYDKALIAVWTTLWLYTLVSDILVDKCYKFSWTGIFIILILLSSVWCSRKDNGLYVRDFGLAVQAFLLLIAVAGLIINPNMHVERYSGPLKNPSIFALYLAGIWAVLLGFLENYTRNREKKIKLIIVLLEMLLTAVLLYASQSLTPILAVLTVTALWGFRLSARRIGVKKTLIMVVVLAFVGSAGLGTLILFATENGVNMNSRIVEKFQSGNMAMILSQRNHYWDAYLRNMNLFGHGQRPYLWGKRRLPHNAVIGMAYTYGVPIIVPYIMMIIMSIEKAFRYANTKVNYASVPLYCIVAFVVMSMADNVEQPYNWLPWIACYFMMTPILVRSVEDIEKMKESGDDIAEKESI